MQTPPGHQPSGGDGALYDLDVVDEAIVNAVAHRDYAISSSKIRLFLFADRLELYSPGKLPNTLSLDNMPYRTFTRNQLLASFLSRIRSKRTGQVFLESRGEGVRNILREGEAHSGRRPRICPVRRRAPTDIVGEGAMSDQLRPIICGSLSKSTPRYREPL